MVQRKKILTVAVMTWLAMGFQGVLAADNTAGAGLGVALGTGTNAPKAENVAIGKGAVVQYSNGASAATGDVAIGAGVVIDNYASQGGSVAMGSNAKVENMAGGGEASFAFGQTTFSGNAFSTARIPADPTKVPGSVAIGQNTFARTGSTMIGVHNYTGQLGDTTVDSAQTRNYNLNVYATTLGTNSHSNGAFTTVTGAYSIISSSYNGGRRANPVQNLGAVINGSLNSIESMNANYYSGIANSITGIANRINNSNGALVYGAGNTITNSFTSLSGAPTDSGASAKAFQDELMTMIKSNNSGGATMAFGGANTADYTLRSALIGVNNTLTGVSGNQSIENVLFGFNNTGTNVDNTTVMGSGNTVTGSNHNIVIGDNHKITAKNNNVILGSMDAATEHTVAEAVVLGHNAEAKVDGGVALGSKTKATIDKGEAGYDVSTNAASTETTPTWKATEAAVSVGDVANNVTRQITSLAAGTADTDAVNVAQLKKVATLAQEGAKHNTVKAGTNVTVDTATNAAGGIEYTINAVGAAAADAKFAGDTGTVSIANGSTLNVKGGATDVAADNNIGVTANGDTLTLKLAKDITGINSLSATTLKAGNTTINTQGITIQNGPSMTATGINAGGMKVTDVADGEIGPNSSDAVTGKQLYALDTKVNSIGNKVSEIGTRVNEVGAGAAALSGLHPLSFDADNKFNVAIAGGFYKNAQAMAVGAFYHPNEDTLLSFGTTIGNADNMVNVGASFKVGSTTKERKVKSEFKDSPISTVYVLEKKLIETRENMDKMQADYEARIKNLEEMVNQLAQKA